MTSPDSLSVIVCAHAATPVADIETVAESVLGQDYSPLELVLVLSDAPELYETITTHYDDCEGVTIVHQPVDNGLSDARNAGASHASGDVVAFVDADVVVSDGWATAIMEPYSTHDAYAVGGPAHPRWRTDSMPAYLPEEMYWLVGCTERGFDARVYEDDDGVKRTRNTYGCNISFRADVFAELGGFDAALGKQHGLQQAEETALCTCLVTEYGEDVVYVPDAVVKHAVDSHQVRFRYLVARAWWQGRSKAKLQLLVPTPAAGTENSAGTTDDRQLGDEARYLLGLLPATARYLVACLRHPSLNRLCAPIFLWLLTAATVGGYLSERTIQTLPPNKHAIQ